YRSQPNDNPIIEPNWNSSRRQVGIRNEQDQLDQQTRQQAYSHADEVREETLLSKSLPSLMSLHRCNDRTQHNRQHEYQPQPRSNQKSQHAVKIQIDIAHRRTSKQLSYPAYLQCGDLSPLSPRRLDAASRGCCDRSQRQKRRQVVALQKTPSGFDLIILISFPSFVRELQACSGSGAETAWCYRPRCSTQES